MRSTSRFPNRCHILTRTQTGVDDFGSPTYDWTITRRNVRCYATRSDVDEMTVPVDVQTSRWTVAFPGLVTVTGRNRLSLVDRTPAVTLQVDGPAELDQWGRRVVTTRVRATSIDVEQAAV